MYVMLDTWTSWFFLTCLVRTTGTVLALHSRCHKSFSKELFGLFFFFFKSGWIYCLGSVFTVQELGRTVRSKRARNFGTQSFRQLLRSSRDLGRLPGSSLLGECSLRLGTLGCRWMQRSHGPFGVRAFGKPRLCR